MKQMLAILIAVMAGIVSANADELAFKLSKVDQQNIMSMPALFNQCVGEITMRYDSASCRIVGQVLNAMSQTIGKEQEAAKAKAAEKTDAKPHE